MKKYLLALMLSLVSVTGFAHVSTMYAFGALHSTCDYVPKSYNWEEFKSAEWIILNSNGQIVLMVDEDPKMLFMINREYDDTQNGIRVIYATETLSGENVKIYYYLNESASKYFKDNGTDKQIFELDIDFYMSRTIISLLLMDVQ